MPRRFLPPSKQLVAKARPGTRLVSRKFYLDPPDVVAQKLLGKLLVRGEMVGRIVEVEAYFGDADAAAHSFAGKTARNAVLFGPPGYAYVYFIYGMYYLPECFLRARRAGGRRLVSRAGARSWPGDNGEEPRTRPKPHRRPDLRAGAALPGIRDNPGP